MYSVNEFNVIRQLDRRHRSRSAEGPLRQSCPLPSIPKNGTRINPPNRDSRYPPVYRLSSAHPLRNPNLTVDKCPDADFGGFRDFVVLIDLTPDGMKSWHSFAHTLEVPDLNAKECMQQRGELYLPIADRPC